MTTAGTTLAYVELGSGPAIVLVSGYTGSKEDFGPLMAPLAAAGFRVVAYDQRGQFESPPGPTPGAYSPDALGADLLDLIAALELAPAHVIGHSFGGLVARAAVIARPVAAASLTLLGSGPSSIGGMRAQVMGLLRQQLLSGGVAAVARLIEEFGEKNAFVSGRFLAHDPRALLEMGDALLAEPDRVEELAAVCGEHQLPVLVCCGVDDDAWPPVVQRQMAARLGASFAEIPASAHAPAMENPTATTAALLAFFS